MFSVRDYNMFKRFIIVMCVFSLSLLSSALLMAEDASLERLKGLKGRNDSKQEDSELRDSAQKDAAYAVAIQSATNRRYREILERVVKPLEKRLDVIFDFQRLMMVEGDVSVVPPIISQAGEALRVEADGRSAVFQSESFLMVSKARIAPVCPNWREYLYIDLLDPEDIHPSLLPVGTTERSLWEERVTRGWDIGLEQAELLFENQVAKLTRDFTGLLLYYQLNAEKQVTSPEVKNQKVGSKATGDELIHGLQSYELSKEGAFDKKP
jgi:defect-in-organelle-trafficking protein DotC